MGYLVLARKWRPRSFTELVGQDPIARILVNAIQQNRISHAYLFSGPRGVGKTTTARILAKALNCVEGPTPEPCGSCAFCTAVTDGSSVDVIEIDGASNNSVDDIRDLREKVKYAPSGGKYKVYIIDEVHMLSPSAFNALLKTLEEPPAHVIFVLATTEMRKIPATVLSRCQHMPFRRISSSVIRGRLQGICDAEGIAASPHALALIARAADGGMRDALTILDQLFSFSPEITEETVQSLLGLTDAGEIIATGRHLLSGDRGGIVTIISALAEQGTDFRVFIRELIQFFRDLLVASVLRDPSETLDLSGSELAAVSELLAQSSDDQLTLMLQELIKAESEIRNASAPQLAIEMALIRASFLSSLKPIKDALDHLKGMTNDTAPRKPGEKLVEPQKKEKIPAPPTTSQSPAPRVEKKVSADTPSDSNRQSAAISGSSRADLLSCWERTMGRLDPKLASKFSHAAAELSGDGLLLTLNGGHAVFAEDITKNLESVKVLLAEEAGHSVPIKIATAEKKTARKKDLKEKVMNEPVVRGALELFEGRIVDIAPLENDQNGGT